MANRLGFDIISLHKQPSHTLLGLRSSPIHTILDIGANTGQFARYIRDIFPKARLYCFEPLPTPYRELTDWAKQQGNGVVTTFNLALGQKEGVIKMFMHTEHSPSSSLLASTDLNQALFPQTSLQQMVDVQLTTLNHISQQLSAELIDDILIKLDVQGYENRVIYGGEELFKRAKAVILEVCLDELYTDQASFKELLLQLDSCGFQYEGNLSQIYAQDGHVIYFDAIFVKK